ncbi:Uncharacterised protein [Legionella waltersii]|nr:Uncharacterised protein [Legionella waltersii]
MKKLRINQEKDSKFNVKGYLNAYDQSEYPCYARIAFNRLLMSNFIFVK